MWFLSSNICVFIAHYLVLLSVNPTKGRLWYSPKFYSSNDFYMWKMKINRIEKNIWLSYIETSSFMKRNRSRFITGVIIAHPRWGLMLTNAWYYTQRQAYNLDKIRSILHLCSRLIIENLFFELHEANGSVYDAIFREASEEVISAGFI